MAYSGGETLRAFITRLHLLDDDHGASDEIISNAGRVIEDFQRFFILHLHPLMSLEASERHFSEAARLAHQT